MTHYLVFGRREYAESLEHVGDVTLAEAPTLATAAAGEGWLELVAFPEDQVTWVVRDGSLVSERHRVTT